MSDEHQLIASLREQGHGTFDCPSCGAQASDDNAYPYCPNGCSEAVMVRIHATRPEPCRQRHEDPGDSPQKCATCRAQIRWADKEADRREQERQATRYQLAVAGGDVGIDALARFPIYSSSEVASREVLADSLPGILGPPGTITEITGYRGSMKSLFVHGIAQAVGHGWERLHDLPLRLHGPVLYVAREGVAGWTLRVRAWADAHGLPDAGDHVRFMHDEIDVTKEDDLAALAALIDLLGAVLLVLDPVAMTGGGREDEETYQRYRRAVLALTAARRLVIILVTNSGHAVLTRGRNSSMLVDGVDQSIALKKDLTSNQVEVVPNKNRDMGKVDALVLRFEGGGEIDPDTGRHRSGIVVRVPVDQLVAEQQAQELAVLTRAKAAADKVLADTCVCPEGVVALREFPNGCRDGAGGVKGEVMALALGVTTSDRGARTKATKEALAPAIKQGYVRLVGNTKAQRWHYGGAADYSFGKGPHQPMPPSS